MTSIVGVVLCVLLFLGRKYQGSRSRYAFEGNTESGPAPVPTITSTVPLSSRRPSPEEPPTRLPTGHPRSTSTTSLSAQLGHDYYTQTSSFSSLSPYIASHSAEERLHITSWSPSAPTPVILGFTPSSEARRLAAAAVAPPAYPDVVEDDARRYPDPYAAPATGDGNREVFGPSADGLPSYETVLATRQHEENAPPPYTPS
ncbi:hypothetical protein GWK47_047813 [Chionoecetes opilio]|uniref:Uncharacterized protein n=1 Tax=Chionoecetes opilio TaxID=41210 RepID=A0A8J5CVJ9_CHIOP|nr:hypothetical protein GWK47_047813 [Chionoecetes opilio]